MAEIELRNVSKHFGAIVAVDDLSLDVKDGEFVVVLGPSGAGKTTTLRLIAGLEGPDSGDVLIDGEIATRVHPSERDCQRCRAESLHEIRVLRVELAGAIHDRWILLLGVLGEHARIRGRDL